MGIKENLSLLGNSKWINEFKNNFEWSYHRQTSINSEGNTCEKLKKKKSDNEIWDQSERKGIGELNFLKVQK